jgi:signal transduction histidine kinase
MNAYHRSEPGLIGVFRLFVGTQLFLFTLGACGEGLDENNGLDLVTLLGLLHGLLLMAYLTWRRLPRWLGSFYLPLGMAGATLGPIFIYTAEILDKMARGLRGEAAIADTGGLILWLFVPLVLVSAQYSMRTMLAFCAATSGLEILLAVPLAVIGGPPLAYHIESALLRAVLFIMVGYVVVRLMNGQRTQRAELAAANAQLAQAASTREQLAISQERNRMARELHDTLAHSLSAVAVQLEALNAAWENDPATAKQILTSAQQLTRDGLQEVRRALRSLRAAPLEDLGLLLALRQLAESAAARAGLQLQLELPTTLPQLPPDTEQNIYRVAGEALENVVRHANAQHLTFSLQLNPHLTLRVQDDGRGFDPQQAAAEGHYGLTGMQERAAMLGGRLEINSRPGAGTTIQLQIGQQGYRR